MKALTQQVYVDDIEAEEEGIAEALMDNDAVAQVARPGTSLRTPSTAQGPFQGLRYKESFNYFNFKSKELLSFDRYANKYNNAVVSTLGFIFWKVYRLRIFVVAFQINCGLVY
jgi:hypothetical protein